MITTEMQLAKKICHFVERNNEDADLNIKGMVHWDLATLIDYMTTELNKSEKNGEWKLEWYVK